VSVLDDAGRIAALDPSGMLQTVESAAEHWRDGVARARAVDLSSIPDHPEPSSVVVCGMGGSGIAGDVAAATGAASGALPVTVTKGFTLPAFTGARTLVVLVSYSGNTAETIACFEQARDRGAQMVAVATGGRLAEFAHTHAFPCVVPAAGMQPRAAFPYLAAAVMVVLERLGVIPDLTGELGEIDEVIREQTIRCGRATGESDNPAKQIARMFNGGTPVVWGQDGPLAVAAVRWKTQLNENAKVPAFASILPELDHNEVVGLGPGAPDAAGFAIAALRTPNEDPRMSRRAEAALRIARERGATTINANVGGVSGPAQLASAVLLGDLASVYLAILRGVDPTPVEAIERLKAEVS
jgi:glucose/mannose-6-phosphate isomerase